jgi:hypothetical protein
VLREEAGGEGLKAMPDIARQLDELARLNDELVRERDGLIRLRDDLMRERDHLILQRNELLRERDGLVEGRPDDPIPSVLFNTLPKSASVFVLETLAKTLGKPVVSVSSGYFPRDQLDFRQVRKLIAARAIAQSHVDASEFNRRYLGSIDKVIVQFRDPRQATLSWLHHLERLRKEGQDDLIMAVTPPLPEGYFGYDLAKKIDYQINLYLPQVLGWQSEWVSYLDLANDPDRFMLNTFEAFAASAERYFASILDFLGVDPRHRTGIYEVTPTTERNFRKGSVDEWRTVFSDSQSRRATAMIPLALKARFDWS